MMNLQGAIKSNTRLKELVYKAIVSNARPRWWVRFSLRPLIVKRGRGAVIRRHVRADILPFNQFIIGDHSTVESYCTLNNGVGDIKIGDNTRVGIGSVVIGPVTIGSQVIIAQHVAISGLNHTYSDINLPIRKQKVTTSPIVIEDEVWIGANAVLTAGITIGKHSVIAGGAVVTKDIPPYCVAVGNPARVVKRYDFDLGEWKKV